MQIYACRCTDVLVTQANFHEASLSNLTAEKYSE